MDNNEPNIPTEYKPLSAWAYFGYQLLFAIPFAGFICAIIFALDNSNINRRNFARSYFCSLVLAVIIFAVVLSIVGTGLLAYGGLSMM